MVRAGTQLLVKGHVIYDGEKVGYHSGDVIDNRGSSPQSPLSVVLVQQGNTMTIDDLVELLRKIGGL